MTLSIEQKNALAKMNISEKIIEIAVKEKKNILDLFANIFKQEVNKTTKNTTYEAIESIVNNAIKNKDIKRAPKNYDLIRNHLDGLEDQKIFSWLDKIGEDPKSLRNILKKLVAKRKNGEEIDPSTPFAPKIEKKDKSDGETIRRRA